MLATMRVLKDNMRNAAARGFINATDCADYLVKRGMAFRDAYKKVGLDIEAGRFTPDKNISRTHEGSIGNLCNAEIAALMDSICKRFGFDRVEKAERSLLDV